ncbi:MAG: histidine phosphotransferase family protein [Pseudomonadota bacterium]
MNNDYVISELMISRLCHDISSPIGAVNNSIELINEGDSDITEQAEILLRDNASDAIARLNFYKVAYGLSTYDIKDISKIREIVSDYFANDKLDLTWSVSDDSVNLKNIFVGGFTKLFFNIIIISKAAALIKGNFEINFINEKRINFSAKSTRIMKPEYFDLLDDLNAEVKLSDMTVHNVNYYVISLLNNFDNIKLTYSINTSDDHSIEDDFSITVEL